jgi:hypothetical protein
MGAQDSPRVTVVGIVTHDRVASLVGSLESYLANGRRHARSSEFVVMDDTAGHQTGPQARPALRDLPTAANQIIRFAGLTEKQRFAESLVRESSVPRPVVDFALFGDARCGLLTGANRNTLLLDTVDTVVMGADDDTLARTASAPERRDPVVFSPEHEPRQFWFFPDRRAALEAVPSIETDVLAAHEQFLGRTLAEVGPVAGLSPTAGEGRIVIAVPGLVGDSGMGAPHDLLTLTGPSRERLLASRTDYLSALRSREVLRTVRQPTIAASAFCMTTFFGFDNRLLLPPFFPVARNSDGIFGLMLQRTIDGSHVAFLPWVLLHAPPEPRAFEGDEAWTGPERVRMADILIASILVHDSGETGHVPGGHGTRLRRLGKYFRELAALKTEEFEAFMGSAQQLRNLTLAALLETRLSEYGASPSFWADDARKTIDLLRRSAARKDYMVPRDVGNARDVDGARRLTQELVAKFGTLLEAWPTLVESTKRLRAKGCRVSEPV